MMKVDVGKRGSNNMTSVTKCYCNICEREISSPGAMFILRKNEISIDVRVNTWGKLDNNKYRAAADYFLSKGKELNHICHRCLLDVCRTGDIDPNGWSKQDMIELKIKPRNLLEVVR